MMMVQNYFYFSLILVIATSPDVGARLYEFTLPTPYDVSNLWDNNRTPKSTIVTTAGIELPDTVLGVKFHLTRLLTHHLLPLMVE